MLVKDMSELSPAERRELRARAHHLHPVVSIAGNGLTEAVLNEIERALKAHELIKIRVYGDDRDARVEYLAKICSELQCEPVQSIGKLLVVYRPNPETAAKAETSSARKSPARKPGRPAIASPRRMALRGQEERPRQRKATAGSSRPRKSAR
jgi:RNA-binding protein